MIEINLAGKCTLPDGWQAKRLRFLCSVEQSGVWGSEPESCDNPTPVVTTADIDSEGRADIDGMTRRCLSQEEIDRYICQPGDIVVVKSSGSATNVITGKAAMARDGEREFAFSNFMLRLRPHRKLVEPEFLFRFVMSPAVKDEIRAMVSTTTYPNLQVSEYLSFAVPLPELPQQRWIISYLNSATGKIDRLMSLRRRQVELLREQRAALIQQAVTRGLHHKVELRDVALGWVDQIPRNWHTGKLRLVTSEIGDGLHGTPKYVEESPYFFINGNNLVDGAIQIFQDTRCVSDTEYRRLSLPLGNRTVLMSINGTLGNVALFRGETIILGKSAAYINCATELDRSFLLYVLECDSAASFLQQEATGTTILNLSLEAIRNFRLVLPPLEEQKEIVKHIEAETAKLDSLHRSYERQLALLAEFQASLTHECVTGQRSVPNSNLCQNPTTN
jgi:type I restriction enzyme, S subunit